MPRRLIGWRPPEDLLEQLDRAAEGRYLTRSGAITEAVREWLAKHAAEEPKAEPPKKTRRRA